MTTKITADNIAANTITSAQLAPGLAATLYTAGEGITIEANGRISAAATVTISGFSVSGTDDLALDPAGGQTVVVQGSGFKAGATVQVGANVISAVTVIDSSTIQFTSEALPSGLYTLYVINTDNTVAILSPGLPYSGFPTFVTASGSLGDYYETQSISETIEATEANDTITYAVTSGALPAGANLLANGTIIGTAPVEANSTTYSFTIAATDEENQTTTRSFSLTINTDVVTWNSPADGTQYEIDGGEAMSNITLSANAASGSAITYTANALPNNVSLVNGVISGTPNLDETVQTQLTATADDTSRSATRNITFVIILGDAFFNQTTLLLNADVDTFITDASDNAFTITPNGDTRPSAFSPYNTNWSNYFDGTEDYLTLTNNAAFKPGSSESFCVELWFYPTSAPGTNTALIGNYRVVSYPANTNGFDILHNTSNKLAFRWGYPTYADSGESATVTLNAWNHVVVCRNTNLRLSCYLNGTRWFTATTNINITDSAESSFWIGWAGSISGTTINPFLGYISNTRLVKGSTPYDPSQTTITPPTTPLTAISGTSLLTCQSNRFIDNSTNNFAITRNGDTKVVSFGPFTETDTSTGSSLYVSDATDACQIADNNNLSFTSTDDFTLECWVYHLGHRTYNYFFSKGSSITREYGFATRSSDMRFYWQQGGDQTIAHSYTFLLNTWYHLAYTNTGGNLRFFINGELVKTQAWSGVIGNTSYPAWIGSFLDYRNIAHSFYGYLSDLRFIKGEALYTSSFSVPTAPRTNVTNTQLLTHQNRISYNNSQPIDESGIKNVITRNGNASAGTFSPHVPTGWSGYFDGTGDYLTINPGTFTLENWHSQDTTIEMWVYPMVHAYSSTNAIGLYLSHGTATAATTYWGLGTTNTGYLKWYYYNGAGQALTATTNPLSLNAWSHVALVYTHSTGAIKGYVNGTEVFSGTKSGTPQTPNSYDLNVGVAQGIYYTGYISNLRIKQGEAVYTSAFTPPTAPLEPDNNTSFLSLRSTNITDDGPNRFPITINADTKIAPFSPFAPHTIAPDSFSVYFDGNGDGIYHLDSAGTNFGTDDFTMECWFYPMSSSATAGVLVDTSKTNTFSTAMGISYKGSTGKIDLFYNGSAAYRTTTTALSLNQWHHVALIRSSGSLRIFLNGVEDTWTAGATTLTSNFNQNNIFIGRWGGNTNYPFLGYISDVRVVKGTAVYTSNFTPPTSPLTAVSGTSVLTCQSSTIIDNSTNNLSLTAEGNSQPTKFNPFGETVTTGVEYSPVLHGGSVYFDGTGDYLRRGTTGDPEFNFGSGNFTIEMFVYQNALKTYASFAGEVPGTTNNTIHFGSAADGSIFVTLTSTQTQINAPAGTCRAGEWQHIALVRNSGVTTLYVDGTSRGTPFSSSAAMGLGQSAGFVIGSGHGGGDLNGYISNLRIVKGTAVYTSNFTPPTAPPTPIPGTTLLINGTNAAIQDKTGRNVLETVGNVSVVNGVKKYGSGAMSFDGTGDWLLCPGSLNWAFGTGDFTIECWFYTNAVSTRGHLVANRNSTDSWELFTYNSKVYFGNGTTDFLIQSDTLSNGAWYHIAVSRSGTSLKLFVNGVEKASATNSTNFSNTTNVLGIGALRDAGTYPLNGLIDDLRITKGVARYTANFTPPTSTYRLR